MARKTDFLDFFRGVAALWVAIAHCWIWSAGTLPGALEPKHAVDLFMVLSGFLMVYTIDHRAERESPASWSTWRNFYCRRFFRIAPAFYVAFAAIGLLSGAVASGQAHFQALDLTRWSTSPYHPGFMDFSAESILLHLTFLFGLLPDYASNSGLPDWSLSLEMQFYWAFPPLYLALRKWNFGLVCIALVVACSVFGRLFYLAVSHGLVKDFPEPSLLLFNLPRFLIGALVYESGRRHNKWLAGLAVAVALVILRSEGASGLLFASIVVALGWLWWSGVPSRLQRLMETRPIRYLADLSYSLYLFHGMALFLVGWPVLSLLSPAMPGAIARVGMTLSVVIVAYAVSWVVWSAIEKPFNQLGKGLLGAPRKIASPMA